MKRIIACILCLTLMITGCSTPKNVTQNPNNQSVNTESLTENSSINDNIDRKESMDQTIENENSGSIENSEKNSLTFTGLDDESLLTYIEDLVYLETINSLNSDEYVVEEVRASYVSKEYLEEVEYNSKANVFFGYTLEDLYQQFGGTKYVFTLGDNGETTVQELVELDDFDSSQVLKNVAIGTGVIVVCVTVSAVSGAVGAPAVASVFAFSAKGAAIGALSEGAIGAISAGIVKGYETGNMEQALKAAATMGSEGFKWGAITGAIAGGVEEIFTLRAGTKGGLTMNEVAKIQKECKYPIEVIQRLNSMYQYNILKKAGLKSDIVNGKMALIRDIDLNYFDEVTKMTNLQRMAKGKPPLDSTGTPYELHHLGQRVDSPLAILTKAEHMKDGNNKILHTLTEGFDAPAKQPEWPTIKKNFWKSIAEMMGGAS